MRKAGLIMLAVLGAAGFGLMIWLGLSGGTV
jgi:hypothetical protein